MSSSFQCKSCAVLLCRICCELTTRGQAQLTGAQSFSLTRFFARARDVKRFLSILHRDSAISRDGIASAVLKRCASALPRPLALRSRKMLISNAWRTILRFHWIVSLSKRKAKSDAANYSGVRLTAQLSKVVERVVGRMFLGKFQRDGVFGERQFAYSINRRH